MDVIGTPCIHDSDCAHGFCDYTDAVCMQPLEFLYDTFVDCVLTRSDPGLIYQLQTVTLQLSPDLTPAELKSAVLRSFLDWDCVNPFYMQPLQYHSRILQDSLTQSCVVSASAYISSRASSHRDVRCPLPFTLTVHGTIYPLCSDYSGSTYDLVDPSPVQCPARAVCDWSSSVLNASTDAAITASRVPPLTLLRHLQHAARAVLLLLHA